MRSTSRGEGASVVLALSLDEPVARWAGDRCHEIQASHSECRRRARGRRSCAGDGRPGRLSRIKFAIRDKRAAKR